jgi:hypothetical protein
MADATLIRQALKRIEDGGYSSDPFSHVSDQSSIFNPPSSLAACRLLGCGSAELVRFLTPVAPETARTVPGSRTPEQSRFAEFG